MGASQNNAATYLRDTDSARLESLTRDFEAINALAQRMPDLVWTDYDGSLLVHSSCNMLRNEIAALHYNNRSLAARLYMAARRAQGTSPRRREGRRRVHISEVVAEIPHAPSNPEMIEFARSTSEPTAEHPVELAGQPSLDRFITGGPRHHRYIAPYKKWMGLDEDEGYMNGIIVVNPLEARDPNYQTIHDLTSGAPFDFDSNSIFESPFDSQGRKMMKIGFRARRPISIARRR